MTTTKQQVTKKSCGLVKENLIPNSKPLILPPYAPSWERRAIRITNDTGSFKDIHGTMYYEYEDIPPYDPSAWERQATRKCNVTSIFKDIHGNIYREYEDLHHPDVEWEQNQQRLKRETCGSQAYDSVEDYKTLGDKEMCSPKKENSWSNDDS